MSHLDPIGVIGSGPLAAAIAVRLAGGSAGSRVITHGITAPADAELPKKARARIEPAANLFDLASECEAVICAYLSHADLRTALTGTQDRPGLLGGLQAGSILVDFSPATPDDCQKLAGQLSGGAIGYIEAAHLGAPDAMREGCARIYVGGFGDHVSCLFPAFEKLGSVIRVGPQGSARMFVALAECVRAATHTAIGEAQAIAAANGFVPEELASPPLSPLERARFAAYVNEALAMARRTQAPLLSQLARQLAVTADETIPRPLGPHTDEAEN